MPDGELYTERHKNCYYINTSVYANAAKRSHRVRFRLSLWLFFFFSENRELFFVCFFFNMIAHKLEKQCVFIEHALNADLYYMTFSSDNNHRLILTVVKKIISQYLSRQRRLLC